MKRTLLSISTLALVSCHSTHNAQLSQTHDSTKSTQTHRYISLDSLVKNLDVEIVDPQLTILPFRSDDDSLRPPQPEYHLTAASIKLSKRVSQQRNTRAISLQYDTTTHIQRDSLKHNSVPVTESITKNTKHTVSIVLCTIALLAALLYMLRRRKS